MQSRTDETIKVDRGEGIATVTLNRPERLNALTPDMRVRYVGTLRALDSEPEVRVIVVTGSGRGFCSGADTAVLENDRTSIATAPARPEDLPTMALSMRKPLVAAVNGAVAGIGFALMLAADVRFVAATAKISTTFARLGLVAEYGTAWLLPRVVGMGRAAELLLSGRTIDGREAADIGLAAEALDADAVLPRAQAWARDVAASCAPWSLRQIKQQLYGDSILPWDEAVQHSVELMRESLTRPDLSEAMQARAARRLPRFEAE